MTDRSDGVMKATLNQDLGHFLLRFERFFLATLVSVGFTSAISHADRPALTAKLEALKGPPGFTGDAPGGPSRWSTKRSTQWQPLATKLGWRSEFPWQRFARWAEQTPHPVRLIERQPVPPLGHFSLIRFGKTAASADAGRLEPTNVI